jgi:hypothetical protein
MSPPDRFIRPVEPFRSIRPIPDYRVLNTLRQSHLVMSTQNHIDSAAVVFGEEPTRPNTPATGLLEDAPLSPRTTAMALDMAGPEDNRLLVDYAKSLAATIRALRLQNDIAIERAQAAEIRAQDAEVRVERYRTRVKELERVLEEEHIRQEVRGRQDIGGRGRPRA